MTKLFNRIRAILYSLAFKKRFVTVGYNLKFRGSDAITLYGSIYIGDNCWIEAVRQYREQRFSPRLNFGHNVMLSNNVHISCVQDISIGSQTLIGSNVYIGDHSHGTLSVDKIDLSVPPYKRVLDDIKPIYIGQNVWIGNGAVILAGTIICDGCVIGANAVVKGEFKFPCIIAGVPAKNVKSLIKEMH